MKELSKDELYAEIVKKYEVTNHSMPHIYINNNSNKIIVTFAAFNSGSRYSCVLSHTQLNDYNHLFIKDESSLYYLSNKSLFENLYKTYLSKYLSDNIIVWGSSMGGYAALKLALEIGCSAMVNCPQIDYETSLEYSWAALNNKLKLINNFENIQDLQINSSSSKIFYAYGNHLLDVSNTAIFKNFIKNYRNIECIFKRYDSTEHTIFCTFKDFKLFLESL